jgi:mannose-6-phosphate isomerase-like protein (cupin superfamily)
MMKRLAALLVFAGFASALRADDERSLAAVYKSADELMAVLAKNAQAKSDQATSPIDNSDHYRINVVRRGNAGIAMAHATGAAKGSEVHYIIDGAATVVTGGALVRSSGGPATIEGGQTRRVAKGDVIFIPAGTPHWYKSVEGSVTYLEVRFDVELKK